MTHGPSGGGAGKAAGEQKLLDQAMEQYPHLFTKDRLWLMDRNFPGTARLARLFVRTHVLIVMPHDGGENPDSRCGRGQGCGGVPGVFQAFPDRFEQQSQLWVKSLRLRG